jgi:dGTPase
MVLTSQGLKDFLNCHLYSHPHVEAERKKVARRLERLFDYFLEHPRSLSPSHYAKVQPQGLHRVVCDYIAGMTDNYLTEQYRKHLGE